MQNCLRKNNEKYSNHIIGNKNANKFYVQFFILLLIIVSAVYKKKLIHHDLFF